MNSEVPHQPLLPWKWNRLLAPCAMIVTAVALIPYARPVFLAANAALRWLPLSSLLSSANQLAGLASVGGAALVIWLLDRPKRPMLAYLAAALLVAGLANTSVKLWARRARPEWSVAMSDKRLARLQAATDAGAASMALPSRDDQWFNQSAKHLLLVDRYASFPSGHACVAFCLAAFLSALYPQARGLWLCAAIACGMARVRLDRHYVDDVLFGGGLGWAISYWIFSTCWPFRAWRAMAKGWHRFRGGPAGPRRASATGAAPEAVAPPVDARALAFGHVEGAAAQ